MKTSLLFFTLVLFQSCAVNQMAHGEKVGRWVYKTTLDGKHKEVARGRYDDQGFQKGTWRYRYKGKLYKKQQFKNSVAYTTYYHANGKIAERGQTKLAVTANSLHYYYFGTWFIYNTKEQLTHVRHYEYGTLQHETKVKP